MSLLSMVELENCDDDLQENLAYVYRLMNHLLLDDHFLEHVDLLLAKRQSCHDYSGGTTQ